MPVPVIPVLPVFNDRVIANLREKLRKLPTLQNMNMQRIRPLLAFHIIKERNWCQAQLNTGEAFLRNLAENPRLLVVKLHSEIFHNLKEFECNHPAGQSFDLRHSISNLQTACMQIRSQLNEIALSGQPGSSQDYHCPYLQCCGVLAAAYGLVHANVRDKSGKLFCKMILSILEKTYIEYNGDLPDRWAIGEPAITHFYRHNIIPNQTEFARNEVSLFNMAKQSLDKTLTTNPSVMQNQYVVKLARSIQMDLAAASVKPKFDIKFAFNTLVLTDTLLKDPQDVNKQVAFQRFIDHAAGKPSLYKKLAGLFLMVAGLAIIAASIFLGVATGMGPYAVWITGAGFAVGCEGIRLFHNGNRQGTSKTMFNLFHLAKTLTPAPSQLANPGEEFRPFSGASFKLEA